MDGMLGCGKTPVVLGSVDASDVAVLVCVGTGVVGSGGGGDGGVVGGVGDVGDGGGGIGIVCGVVIMALGGAAGGEIIPWVLHGTSGKIWKKTSPRVILK